MKQEFSNAMSLPVPEKPDFGDKLDEPITELELEIKKDNDSIEEVWTGNYVFENEWQSFRTKDDKKLELISSEKEILNGKTKVAVKVVDIFGNDTMKVITVRAGK